MNEWEDALAVRDTAYLYLFFVTILLFVQWRWWPWFAKRPAVLAGLCVLGLLFSLSVVNMWIWQL